MPFNGIAIIRVATRLHCKLLERSRRTDTDWSSTTVAKICHIKASAGDIRSKIATRSQHDTGGQTWVTGKFHQVLAQDGKLIRSIAGRSSCFLRLMFSKNNINIGKIQRTFSTVHSPSFSLTKRTFRGMTLAPFWMPTSQINAKPSCGEEDRTPWMPAKTASQPTKPAP